MHPSADTPLPAAPDRAEAASTTPATSTAAATPTTTPTTTPDPRGVPAAAPRAPATRTDSGCCGCGCRGN